MELEIDLNKSLHENASYYYDLAKKTRKKVEGARKALEISKKQLTNAKEKEVSTTLEKKRDRQWFEKYHWLKTTNGFLAIGGRDAKSNETIVKKQMNQDDLFFHADIKGASVVILIDGQKAKEEDKQDAARLAAVFSKAWQAKVGSIDVYSVKPDQVKMAAKAGEFLPKGSFVMEGKREWYKNVPLTINMKFDEMPQVSITGGITIVPGKTKKSDLAKKLKAKFSGTLDDWIMVLPSGGDLK